MARTGKGTVRVEGSVLVVFAVLLLVAAAALMAAHVRSWRSTREQALPPRDRDYYRIRYRRRMQTSGMLGTLAVMLFAGNWVTTPPLGRWVVIGYWGVALLLVLWVALLAIFDILSTRFHFARARREVLVERARLQAEVRRLTQRQGNGRPAEELGDGE